MAYIVSKVFVTKARYSKDGKEHRHTNYYGGTQSAGLIGMDFWGNKSDAYRFTDRDRAERCARVNGGKVIEVED